MKRIFIFLIISGLLPVLCTLSSCEKKDGVLQAVGVDAGTASIATAVAGQAASLMNLKYSRNNETEADHMGLVFAAMAGYDPRVAVSFWQRMASSGGSSTPTWLSSHPSDAQRISDIQNKFLPEALKYYKGK